MKVDTMLTQQGLSAKNVFSTLSAIYSSYTWYSIRLCLYLLELTLECIAATIFHSSKDRAMFETVAESWILQPPTLQTSKCRQLQFLWRHLEAC